MAAELAFLQMRLRASERTAELLKRKNAGRHHRQAHSAGLPVMMSHPVDRCHFLCVVVLAGRLCSTEKMVEELLQQTSGQMIDGSSVVQLSRLFILISLQTCRCPTAPPSRRDWRRSDWRSRPPPHAVTKLGGYWCPDATYWFRSVTGVQVATDRPRPPATP